jgi:hypothetical protein
MRKLLKNPIFVSAFVIVLINSIALFLYKSKGKDEIEIYYKHFEPLKFYILQLCYTILVLSLSYNSRFIVSHTLKTVWHAYLKSTVLPMLPKFIVKSGLLPK